MKKLNNIRELKENPVKLIADDWGLVCAGKADNCNAMTVSWGSIGELWGKDVVFTFIRPQRYTKKFLDEEEYFTLCFFDEKYKDALRICGTKSGRDCDKLKLSKLSMVSDGETVYPDEARLVIKCKKIAVQKMDNAGFIDKSIESNYSQKDYHFVYIGEIVEVLEK